VQKKIYESVKWNHLSHLSLKRRKLR
jgi:hypothetical protein